VVYLPGDHLIKTRRVRPRCGVSGPRSVDFDSTRGYSQPSALSSWRARPFRRTPSRPLILVQTNGGSHHDQLRACRILKVLKSADSAQAPQRVQARRDDPQKRPSGTFPQRLQGDPISDIMTLLSPQFDRGRCGLLAGEQPALCMPTATRSRWRGGLPHRGQPMGLDFGREPGGAMAFLCLDRLAR
jgi:hypothetical protein